MALPLIAVEVLDADSTMGLLVAAVWPPWLLVGLPVCNDGGPVQEAAWAQGSGCSGGDSGGFCRLQGAEVPFRVEGYGCTGPRCCDGLAAGVVDEVSVGEDAGDVRTGGG